MTDASAIPLARERWNTASCLNSWPVAFPSAGEHAQPMYSELEVTITTSSLCIYREPVSSAPSALTRLQQQGRIQWGGQRLQPIAPIARVRGEGTVAELIVSERR